MKTSSKKTVAASIIFTTASLMSIGTALADCQESSRRAAEFYQEVLQADVLPPSSVAGKRQQFEFRAQMSALELEFVRCSSTDKLMWRNLKDRIEEAFVSPGAQNVALVEGVVEAESGVVTESDPIEPLTGNSDLPESVKVLPVLDVSSPNGSLPNGSSNVAQPIPQDVSRASHAVLEVPLYLELDRTAERNFTLKTEEFYGVHLLVMEAIAELRELESERLSKRLGEEAYPEAVKAFLKENREILGKEMKKLLRYGEELSKQSQALIAQFDKAVGNPEGRQIVGSPNERHFYSDEDKDLVVSIISNYITQLVESKSYQGYMLVFNRLSDNPFLDYRFFDRMNKPSQLGLKLPELLKDLAKGISSPYLRKTLDALRVSLSGSQDFEGHFQKVNRLCVRARAKLEKAKTERLSSYDSKTVGYGQVLTLVGQLKDQRLISAAGIPTKRLREEGEDKTVIDLLSLLEQSRTHLYLSSLVTAETHLQLIEMRHRKDVVKLRGYKKVKARVDSIAKRNSDKWTLMADQALNSDKDIRHLMKKLDDGSNREILGAFLSLQFVDRLQGLRASALSAH